MHAEAGVLAPTIQRWLGHSHLATTLRYLAIADIRSASIGRGRGLWLQDPAAPQINALEDELGSNSSIAIDREHY
jgi:hypothetical protein